MAGLFNILFSVTREEADGYDSDDRFFESDADPAPASIWGRLSPVSARQASEAALTLGRVTHRFSCDSGADIRIGDIVTGNDQEVRIVAVRKTSSGRRKECLADHLQTGTASPGLAI